MKELCWDEIKEQSIALSPDRKAILINHEQNRERVKKGFRNQAIQDSIHGQDDYDGPKNAQDAEPRLSRLINSEQM